MKRGDLFRSEATGLALEDGFIAAIQESDASTHEPKHMFGRDMWEAEAERERTLRAKGERLLALPTIILTTLLSGGIVALANSWFPTPWAHAMMWTTLVLVMSCGLTALWFGYKVLSVRLGQSIHPGLALEKHDAGTTWHAHAAAHYLAQYKANLTRLTSLAFHVRLIKEWTLATVVAGLLGALAAALAWLIETDNSLSRTDTVAALGGALAWIVLFWRLVKRPKDHSP